MHARQEHYYHHDEILALPEITVFIFILSLCVVSFGGQRERDGRLAPVFVMFLID